MHRTLHYIPMSKAVYNQYDGRLGEEPLPFAPVDCTHWCYPSNIEVFKYIHRMIFNSFLKAAVCPYVAFKNEEWSKR